MRSPEFDRDVIATRSKLIAFARKLCRDLTAADDLVQETIAKALKRHETFEPGTNIAAWLFTIMRNEFLTGRRKAGRFVEDVDGVFSTALLKVNGSQADSYDLKIILGQMEQLNPVQRASLEMVGMDQMTYEEVGDLLGIPPGTVKSQVSRARAFLLDIYEGRTKAMRR